MRGGVGGPYWAVPVLAWVPAGRPVPAAVPLVTTLNIICCKSETTVGDTEWVGAASSGAPATRRGDRTVPVSSAAATMAMASGDTTT